MQHDFYDTTQDARIAITMGLSVSTLFSFLSSLVKWSKEQDVRIIMLGLDSAGKTTILYRLQVGSTRFKLTIYRTLSWDNIDRRSRVNYS